MIYWTILHILAMFIAFGFTTGVGICVSAIANAGDVRTIRTAAKVALPLMMTGGVVLGAGVVFGFATAMTAGYDLASKWLLGAYLVVALLIITGIGVHQRWVRRLAAAAAGSSDDHASPELAATINDRLVRAVGPISGLLWIAAIALMVLKPS